MARLLHDCFNVVEALVYVTDREELLEISLPGRLASKRDRQSRVFVCSLRWTRTLLAILPDGPVQRLETNVGVQFGF